jgi:hypothetical protein
MSAQLESGIIRSPKIVYDEVVKGNDWVADWVRTRREKGLSVPASKAVHNHFRPIADYVVQRWGDRKAREFLLGGDCWVIAHAKEMGDDGIVVTQESKRSIEAKVKTPTVCEAVGVECITIFQMLDEFDFSFADWR